MSGTPLDLLPEHWPVSALDRAFARFVQSAQPSDDARHALLAALVSHQYGRGHACLDLDLLASDGPAYLGWAPAAAPLPDALAEAAATLPWAQGEGSPLVRVDQRLYLRRNWLAEQRIQAALLRRMQAQIAPLPQLAHWLDRLFPPTAGTQPPDWQEVACALAARARLTLITGGPGTGKTTTVVKLLALLQATHAPGHAPLRVALAAPTGKAAARLSASMARAVDLLPAGVVLALPDKAQTLHKLLQLRALHTSDRSAAAAQVLADVVVVDEASMIDLEMMARLVEAVPPTARLVLLGDKDQLASVEAGAVMAQLCEGAEAGGYSAGTVAWVAATTGQDIAPWQGAAVRSELSAALAQHTVMLRQSRRFSESGGIGQWARAVNTGQQDLVRRLWLEAPSLAPLQDAVAWPEPAVCRLETPAPGTQGNAGAAGAQGLGPWCRLGWQHWLDQVQALQGTACTDASARQVLGAFARFQVLCALREGPFGVEALNQRIAHSLHLPVDGWYPGRPVMVTRNDYALGLMNGDVGICLPHALGLRVAFERSDGGIHWVLPARLEAVDTVFAMTVHKAQGSEFDHVALVLPSQPTPVLTRELLYTGITRAKERLTLVVPQPDLLIAATRARVLRSGGLARQAARPPGTAVQRDEEDRATGGTSPHG